MPKEMTITSDYSQQYREQNKGEGFRVETQFCFDGTNDIKQRKVLEAKKALWESGVHTVMIHFDLYNEQVALILLDQIKDNDEHWITRINTDWGTLFNIDQNHFVWNLIQTPPEISQPFVFEYAG